MNFQIAVGQHSKFLFRTDMKDCRTPEQLERIFVIFLNKFPASEGYYMSVYIHWEKSLGIDKDALIEAINNGKGKTYIRMIRNQRKKADWMGFLLYKNMKAGML